jgi:hypothetical protein
MDKQTEMSEQNTKVAEKPSVREKESFYDDLVNL